MTKVTLGSDRVGLPLTADDLVDMLEEAFPNKSPQIHESEKELYYRAGQRSVVEYLIHLRNEDTQGV